MRLLVGRTVIDVSVGGGPTNAVTVRVVELNRLLSWAAMLVLPAATAAARPAGVIVATAGVLENQVTVEVTSVVEASV